MLINSQGFIVSSNLAQAVGKAKVEHLFSNLIAGKNVSFEILASTLHQIADISEDRKYQRKTKLFF